MANNEIAAAEEKKQSKAFQLVLSLLIFAGFVVFLFVPDLPVFETSLWTQVLNLFKGEFDYGNLLKAAMFAAVGTYAVLLVCTVASFFCKRSGARALNFIKSLVAVLAAVFFAYAVSDQSMLPISAIFRSDETYFALNAVSFSLALGLLALIVLSFSAYKGFGAVKLIFLLLGAAFFVFCEKAFIGTYVLRDLFGGIELAEGTLNAITEICFAALAWAVLVNGVFAVLVLIFPRTGVIDVIRSAIVFVLAVAAAVLLGVYDSFSNLFDYTGTVAFAAIAIVQLIYAIAVAAVLHAKNKKKAAAAEDAEDAQFVTDANNQMAVRGWEAPAEPQPAAAVQPEPVPDAKAQAEAERTNKAFEDAAQISIEEIEKENSSDSNDYDDIIRDKAAENAEPEEEKPFDFEQAKYDGNFNRAYQEFAEQEERKKEETKQEEPQQQPYYGYASGYQQPNYQQPPYYGAQQPYAPPYAQQNAAPYYAPGYIPDAFLSSLTPAERDEFDRLFISRIYGDNKRLPAYRVGGDNREFFTKIFVFMGRYRNVITDGLLEKIYNYSNSIR